MISSLRLQKKVWSKHNDSMNIQYSKDVADESSKEQIVSSQTDHEDIVKTETAKPRTPGAGRLIALDAARGIAVLGMYLQHFGSNPIISSIVAGNTTLLFVLCGGISYSIMSQRMMNRGEGPEIFRSKMLARAVFIDLIGYLLIMLNTSYGIILPAYAAMFVFALLLYRRTTRTIVTTATILLLIAPPLMLIGSSLLQDSYLLSDIAGGPISALALSPAFVIGMAIGRLDLTSMRTSLLLTITGAIIFVISKILNVFVLPEWSKHFEQWIVDRMGAGSMQPPDEYAIWPLNTTQLLWHMLLSSAPHTASTFQTLTGLGLSFLVLGIVCLSATKVRVLWLPFAAVGRVALTMYALQFIIVWILDVMAIDYSLEGIMLGDLIVVIIGLLLGWLFSRFSNGPLEKLMRRFDQWFTPIRSSR